MASTSVPVPHSGRFDTWGELPLGVGRRYERAGGRAAAQDSALQKLGLNVDKEAGSTAFANDFFSNASARMGWGTPSLTEGTDYTLVRLTYDYWLMVTLYRNHWIMRKVVDVPARDMIRAWPKLTSDIDPKDITRVDRSIRLTQTKQQMLDGIIWGRLFGGAGAVIMIDGHENRLDEELDIETVELGSYRGLIPFDRWAGIYPDGEICSDIRKPTEFNLPTHYRVQTPGTGKSFRVHASRVLRFNGPSVPYPEYQAQQYWGISVIEPVYEELRKRDNLSWNIISLSFRASLIGMKFGELAQMLSGASMTGQALQKLQERMMALNQVMSNQSLLLLPKDGGLESVQQNITGWPDMYQQFQMDIAGAAEIPVTRLYGRTLTGLGQSNDADERVYEERIALDQDNGLRPQLEKLYPVICMSELGEVPDDLDLKFPSIRVLDEKEKSDLGKTVTDSVIQVFNAGLIKKSVALKELQQQSDVTGLWTNITDTEIADAEKEQDMAGELAAAQQQAMLEGSGDPGAEPRAPGLEADLEAEAAGAAEEETGHREAAPKPKAARDRFLRISEVLEAARQPGGKETAHARDSFVPSRPHRALPDQTYGYRGFFAGLPIVIEYRVGERRIIRNDEGDVVYHRLMQFDYGYIRNTVGRDGDEIDIILGRNAMAPFVYVADMQDLGPDLDKREDEDKVLVGFDSKSQAKEAFYTMYPPDFLRGIETVPIDKYIANIRFVERAEGIDAVGGYDFEESKIKRAPAGTEHGGQFASKGGGSGSGKAGASRALGQKLREIAARREAPAVTPPSSEAKAKEPYKTGITLMQSTKKAFNGQPVKTRTTPAKHETGAIGERVVLQYLQNEGLADARPLDTTRNNAAVDLVADHRAIEVKTGLVSNGASAQHWRATIGQPGKTESAWLKKASPEAKRRWNQKKEEAIIARKKAAVEEVSQRVRRKMKPTTITTILNPDTKTVDVYRFDGFHLRIPWQSEQARKAFVGSFKYK